MHRPETELLVFRDARGRCPFFDWFRGLEDRVAQARVMQRLDRLQSGNPGDSRSLGAGLMELRIDAGPGYRVYWSWMHDGRCLVFGGGTKRTQRTDIARARRWLQEAGKQQGR